MKRCRVYQSYKLLGWLSFVVSTFFSALWSLLTLFSFFFFFNDTATTEIYTLSLHDALPILLPGQSHAIIGELRNFVEHRDVIGLVLLGTMLFFSSLAFTVLEKAMTVIFLHRSEEHTSELQSRSDLVCRLLLEKKKKTYIKRDNAITGHLVEHQQLHDNTEPVI